MGHDERGQGIGTATVVAGGIGCLVLVAIVLFAGLFLVRGTSVAPAPTVTTTAEPARSAPAGWGAIAVTSTDGRIARTVLSAPEDGSARELHVHWNADRTHDDARSGSYENGERVRATTAEELALAREATFPAGE